MPVQNVNERIIYFNLFVQSLRHARLSLSASAQNMSLCQRFECDRYPITEENICSTKNMDGKTAKSVLMTERVIMELRRLLENNYEGEPDRAEMKILKRILQDEQISALIIEESYGNKDWTSFAAALENLYPQAHFSKPKKITNARPQFSRKKMPDKSLFALIKTMRNKMAHRNSGAHTLSRAFDYCFPGIINLFTNLLAMAIEDDDLLVIAGEIDKHKSLCDISCVSELEKSDIPSDMNGYIRSDIVEFMQDLMKKSNK